MTKQRGNKRGKVGGLQVQKVGMVGKTREGGGYGHEPKAATWAWACGRYTWVYMVGLAWDINSYAWVQWGGMDIAAVR